jgi:NADH:ubiquinone oxidoreductase subunit E
MTEVGEATLEQHVDTIIDRYSANRQFSLAILQDIQRTYNYLPREALEHTAKRLDTPLSEVYRLATFFAAFSLEPKGEYVVKVCLGTACHVQGSPRILEQLERDLGIEAGQTTADGRFSVEGVRCLGACALAPVILVNEEAHGKMSSATVSRLIKALGKGSGAKEEE